MPKRLLNTKHIDFIKANRFEMSGSDMARHFGVQKSVVNRYMSKHGLSVDHATKMKFKSKALTGRSTFTEEEDQFIRDNYLKYPVKTLAAMMDKRSFTGIMGRLKAMGLEIPSDLRQQRKHLGQIKPGNVPMNKGRKMSEWMSPEGIENSAATRFKKGNQPHNTASKDGEISTRHEHPNRNNSKPYKYIRVALGKWKPLHVYTWEQKNGKVPAGMIVRFKDGDTMNTALENLALISRSENMELNTIARYPKEVRTTMKLISKLNKKITNAEKQNN